MVRSLLFPLTIVLFMVTSGFSQTNETRVITVGSRTHHCIWHVPKEYNKPAVVFFVHGAGGSGGAFQRETKGDTVADKEHFIAVYPSASRDGTGSQWADMWGTSDFPFYLAVIDTLKKRYSIDTNRIYMTGFSQGGMISFVAGCSYSKVFAAVAPVSGHAGTTCTIKRPVPMFITFGTQDYGVTNGDLSSFWADMKTWLKLDSCPSTPTLIHPYPASKPSSKVGRISYGPCAQGSYVIVDTVSRQTHMWPTDRNQAEEVWAFFKQFSLKGPETTTLKSKIISHEKPFTVSYISEVIKIQGMEKNCQIKVTDTKGRLIVKNVNTRSQLSFTNKPSGVYMVVVGEKEKVAASRIVVP
ncbi:MAG TPA: PHB depolymerase family esterase [Chitinispirillaceae bacterium]|nr:PHB depolymerase family esterase [Chitinispirillaceae bacterium]